MAYRRGCWHTWGFTSKDNVSQKWLWSDGFGGRRSIYGETWQGKKNDGLCCRKWVLKKRGGNSGVEGRFWGPNGVGYMESRKQDGIMWGFSKCVVLQGVCERRKFVVENWWRCTGGMRWPLDCWDPAWDASWANCGRKRKLGSQKQRWHFAVEILERISFVGCIGVVFALVRRNQEEANAKT